MLCCCLHSLVPRVYRDSILGTRAAGRQPRWLEEDEEEEEEEEEGEEKIGQQGQRGRDGDRKVGYEGNEKERRQLYEMVPISPREEEESDVRVLLDTSHALKKKSYDLSACLPPPPRSSGSSQRVKGTSCASRVDPEGAGTVEKSIDGAPWRWEESVSWRREGGKGKGGEEGEASRAMLPECVICLEEFTEENPEIPTREEGGGAGGSGSDLHDEAVHVMPCHAAPMGFDPSLKESSALVCSEHSRLSALPTCTMTHPALPFLPPFSDPLCFQYALVERTGRGSISPVSSSTWSVSLHDQDVDRGGKTPGGRGGPRSGPSVRPVGVICTGRKLAERGEVDEGERQGKEGRRGWGSVAGWQVRASKWC
ncbi:hypothetical protein NSK_005848 [Nannochloropsis salina CCMP1776]|jgi:hypothetical protein|uniref:Uncharacterized protein n=1 Tax=Nannochloropsis salina CCMP1776 TaxID=1027361 RepID=A0A4D9CU87_9STRA|nr:hypothetical protein NSK_005848 [Nannochloropsis salina CCMP1776]|eukprot:TFJ82841.1 hypothetical protein NSK_005848 [Nannochloropsis salina CCMP1776]